jgi:hypothetical protein
MCCIRQRLMRPEFRAKLQDRLRALASRAGQQEDLAREIEANRAALEELSLKRDKVAENLAHAANDGQYRAISSIFDKLDGEYQALDAQLRQLEQTNTRRPQLEAAVSGALEDFDRLTALAEAPANLEAIGKLFDHTNARLFLSFREVQPKNRKLNVVAGGVVTFGTSTPPVKLYEGPTGRRALKGTADLPRSGAGITAVPVVINGPDREGKSLGNLNRADGI